MSGQEIAAFALGTVALGYVLTRYLRRRATGNCCGEARCPAADEVVRRLERQS